jgi:GNAT superfamily N-acetyltransferase
MPADSKSTRLFSAEDQEEVRALVLAGLGEHFGDLDPSLNHDLLDIAASYRHGQTIVVEMDGELVGTGTLVPTALGAAELKRVAVRSDHRRRGVGRAIVDRLAAIAVERGQTKLVLETSDDWAEAVEFYLGCGFVITHREAGRFGLNTWFELGLEPAP